MHCMLASYVYYVNLHTRRVTNASAIRHDYPEITRNSQLPDVFLDTSRLWNPVHIIIH